MANFSIQYQQIMTITINRVIMVIKVHYSDKSALQFVDLAGRCTCSRSLSVRQKGDISLQSTKSLACSTYYINV